MDLLSFFIRCFAQQTIFIVKEIILFWSHDKVRYVRHFKWNAFARVPAFSFEHEALALSLLACHPACLLVECETVNFIFLMLLSFPFLSSHAWHFLFTIVNCVLWFLFHVDGAFFSFFIRCFVKGSEMAVRETINRVPCLPNLLLSPIFIAQSKGDTLRWRWNDTTNAWT